MTTAQRYPEPQPAYLDPWVGWWVAVKDDEVIASAKSSYELGRILIDTGIDGPDVCTQYVPRYGWEMDVAGGVQVVG